MGRPLRLKAPDVTYHVVSRTNGKKILMNNGKDKKALCRCLQKIKLKYGAKIYGFTPMGNHFHLLIKITGSADLSQFLCEFKTTYAKYFNSRYNLSGHFWGDRFKSTIVQDDKHILACLRYMDRNPLRAGVVDDLANWEFGTYACYAYGRKHQILTIELHPTYLGLSTNPELRRSYYLDFITEKTFNLEDGRLEKFKIFGNKEFVRSFQ